MFKRIAGTRNLSIENVPTYMDEYDALEDVYFGRIKEGNAAKLRKLRGLYEYINHLKPPKTPSVHTPYRLLFQIASVAPVDGRIDYVLERLRAYRLISSVDGTLRERIRLAANWADEFKTTEKTKVELDEGEMAAISHIVGFIMKTKDPDAEAIQNEIFEAARSTKIPPTRLFKTLYQIFIGSERGPRLGPYIADIGPKRAADILADHLEG
jgi:lysyl-tRNA synthetase class 1